MDLIEEMREMSETKYRKWYRNYYKSLILLVFATAVESTSVEIKRRGL